MLFQNKIKYLSFLWVIFFPFIAVSQMTKQKVDQLCAQSRQISDFKEELQKIDSAYSIAKAINYKGGMLNSRLLKAAWYLNSDNDVKSSLEAIKEIESEILDSENFERISYLKLIKGTGYARLSFNEQAQKELTSAISFAEKIKDKDIGRERKAIIFMCLGAIYNDIEPNSKTDESNRKAGINFKKAYDELLLIDTQGITSKKTFLNSTTALAHYYNTVGKLDSAQFYLDKSVLTAENLKDYDGEAYAYAQLGALNFSKKDYKSAIKNYERSNKLISLSNASSQLLKDNYYALKLIYENLGDKENHQKYLKEYQKLSDSLSVGYKQGVVKAMDVIGEDIHSLHEKDKKQYKIWIVLASISSLLLALLIYFIYKNYKSEKNNNEKLKNQLDQKMKELHKLSERFDPDNEKELKEVVRLAMANDASFLIRFNELFPRFCEKLLTISPTLKSNDLKICSYMRLNFDTKEIARYGGDTVRSVESKKYRLRKKFGLSSTEDINIWISKL